MPADHVADLFDSTGGRTVGLRLALLSTALVANVAVRGAPLQLALVSLGVSLLAIEGRRRRTWLMWAGIVASAAAAVVVGVLFDIPRAVLLRPALRWMTGAAFCLWFGATVSWPGFLRWLEARRAPVALLEIAELGMAHGLLLARAFGRKREAAITRGGRGLALHGEIVGAGLTSAMARAGALEEARLVRGATAPAGMAAMPVASDAPTLVLDRATVAGQRLRAVSLAIDGPIWVAVAGPSGAGKSTLLRLLAGLEIPVEGALRRFGAPVTGRRLEARVDPRVALVFQDPEDQLFGATPLDDLLRGLRWRGVTGPAAARRASDALASLGLLPLANRPIHQISFGERKRLALAGALVTDAEVILCDEPTMGLDLAAAEAVAAAFEAVVRSRPVTVVWATHDLAHLPEPVRRLVLLREGEIVFDGPAGEGTSPAVLARAGLRR